MKAAHKAYARARDALLDAQKGDSRDELKAAEKSLRAAEEPIADEIEAAWQRNIDAVQAAKQACRDAISARLKVETEVAEAVNKRLRYGLQRPGEVLITEEEQARLDGAVEAELAAREANVEAEARFKAGVLPEQLVEAG